MNTKEKILTTFYNLVSEKGYEKASMNDVVKIAGISKGAIYHHFTGKEQLFLETVTFIFLQGNEELIDINKITNENYKQVLKETGIGIINNIKIQPHYNKFFYEFLMASLRYDNIKSATKEIFSTYITFIENIFSALNKKNIFNKDIDEKLIAHKFFIFLDALSLYQTYELDFDYEVLWSSFIDDIFK